MSGSQAIYILKCSTLNIHDRKILTSTVPTAYCFFTHGDCDSRAVPERIPRMISEAVTASHKGIAQSKLQ